ncbi:MAG: nitronate monooxygenase [Acetobacteraceae bacterium]|nr:nitronate monooxygenase [Acetobacteraceae bacterium]
MDDVPRRDDREGDSKALPERIETRATRLLGIRYPIVQGGLARIAGPELAAAVSEAGGLGQIATSGLTDPEALRAAIRRCRALTAQPFGVNLPLGRFDVTPMLEVALEERVAVLAFTAGNPAPHIRRAEGSGAKILVLTAGPELARKAEAAGAHIVATVGYEGGGHIGRGDETTLVMVPRVVDAVRIPVLALGADGVEMGTRFVATAEASAHDNYKRAVCAAGPADTMIIKRSLGQPGRVLISPYARHVAALEAAGAQPEEIVPLVGGGVNHLAAVDGHLEQGFVWAGQSAGLIGDVEPAGEVVRRIAREAAAQLGRLDGMLREPGLATRVGSRASAP